MIDLDRHYEKIYAAYLEITILHQPLKFTIREIDNVVAIDCMLCNCKKFVDIYWVEHWFSTKGECQKYIDGMNRKTGLTMIDYFKNRFNLSEKFVLNNKRNLQKLIYYIKRYKEC